LVLETVGRRFGRDSLDRLMATYFHRWRFRHPRTEDFLAVADETGPEELAAFVREAVAAPRLPDSRIERAGTAPWQTPRGRIPDVAGVDQTGGGSAAAGAGSSPPGLDPAAREPDGRVLVEVDDPGWVTETERVEGRTARLLLEPDATEAAAPDPDWHPEPDAFHRSAVRIAGPGWRHLPVDVTFRFADGVQVTDRWDGRSRWRGYHFLRPAPLREVRIDPRNELVLDPFASNNGRRLVADHTLADRVAPWLGTVVEWLALGLGWL